MGVNESGWDDEWNKPHNELTASELAAIKQHTENAMWAARLARQRQNRPASRPTSRLSSQEAHRAQELQRAVEQKRTRKRNHIRYLTVAIGIMLSIICLVGGMLLHGANPSSELAGILVTIGVIGCIMAVPAIMLAAVLSN